MPVETTLYGEQMPRSNVYSGRWLCDIRDNDNSGFRQN